MTDFLRWALERTSLDRVVRVFCRDCGAGWRIFYTTSFTGITCPSCYSPRVRESGDPTGLRRLTREALHGLARGAYEEIDEYLTDYSAEDDDIAELHRDRHGHCVCTKTTGFLARSWDGHRWNEDWR